MNVERLSWVRSVEDADGLFPKYRMGGWKVLILDSLGIVCSLWTSDIAIRG